MSIKEILALPEKCPRLHPYCLIGLHIDKVRTRMAEWSYNIVRLTSGQGHFMDFDIIYYYATLDKNNIMIDVNRG
jgi:hypothetical protein